MNKAELISAIATDAGVSKSVASKVLDSMINNVTESLKKGREGYPCRIWDVFRNKKEGQDR
ncbi:hypothetical protein BLFGPEAP_01012 [Candidatus Methanoperedenaceae archaeon GB50]|nr:hypothetical protein BLFGPEAP_01012 [Candidatus Methanoperedenaceae archaeon GB50]